jgi:hypothetical protein
MRRLRGLLLSLVALVLASQAGAASFTVTDFTVDHRASYVVGSDCGHGWTAYLKATLDGFWGTSFCVDLGQSISPGHFEGGVHDHRVWGGHDYFSPGAIAHDSVPGGDLSGPDGEKVVHLPGKPDQVVTPSVPEPSALLCFGAGGLLIGAVLRRKR